jgi:hypothetical protein
MLDQPFSPSLGLSSAKPEPKASPGTAYINTVQTNTVQPNTVQISAIQSNTVQVKAVSTCRARQAACFEEFIAAAIP